MSKSEFFVEEETRLVHPDGWLFYLRDGDEGLVEFGYRELRDNVWKDVTVIHIGNSFLPELAKVFERFAGRRASNENKP